MQRAVAQEDAYTAQLRAMAGEILRAFERADLVGVGERHRSKQDSDLRLAIVRHPDFASTVDVIIVEFASATQQALLDRYVLEGADLRDDELKRITRDCTGNGDVVFESPIYRELFRAVREVNLSLPAEERVRILAGDPGRDWESIKTWRDVPEFQSRDRFTSNLYEREVAPRDLKCLAFWGVCHIARFGFAFTISVEHRHPGDTWVATPISRREGRRVFAQRVDPGEKAHLVPTDGLPIADASAMDFLPCGGSYTKGATLGGVVEAAVWFGGWEDETINPPEPTEADLREHARRSAILREWRQRRRER